MACSDNAKNITFLLESFDTAGVTLVESQGQVVKKELPLITSLLLVTLYIVMNDRRVTLIKIVETLGLSYDTVHKILQIGPQVIQFAASWLPKIYL